MAVAVHGRCSSPAKLHHTKPVAQHENDERNKERSGGAFAEVLHNRPPSISLLFLKVVRSMNDQREVGHTARNRIIVACGAVPIPRVRRARQGVYFDPVGELLIERLPLAPDR
jgi:hypothetical protein